MVFQLTERNDFDLISWFRSLGAQICSHKLILAAVYRDASKYFVELS